MVSFFYTDKFCILNAQQVKFGFRPDLSGEGVV